MESMISTRIPNQLHDHIEATNINQSEIVRTALENELMRKSVGVCAVTGDRCFSGEFATIGATTPLGKDLNTPREAGDVDVTNDIFETASKILNSGGDQLNAEYMNEIGVATYKAETDYIADTHANTLYSDAWSRRAFKDQHDDEETAAVTRLSCLLEWIVRTNPEHDLITLENVWEEHNREIQDRIKTHTTNSRHPDLITALDKLGVN